jgi:hypothetical protein
MPDGDGAHVEIEPVVGNLEALELGRQFAQRPQRLGSERFVDLPHADLVGSDTSTGDDLGHRSRRCDAHRASLQGVNPEPTILANGATPSSATGSPPTMTTALDPSVNGVELPAVICAVRLACPVSRD